jgi:preprotein translocase subunit YajC
MSSLIIVVFLFALAWVFLVLPSRRRQRAHRAMQDELAVGDEIISAGGLHGVVRSVGDDEIEFEIAPGVVVTLDRRAVAAVARDQPGDAPDQNGHEEGRNLPQEGANPTVD